MIRCLLILGFPCLLWGQNPCLSAEMAEEVRNVAAFRTQMAAALHCATNTARQENGLPPLRKDSSLYQAAQKHSEAMRLGDFFSHRNRQKQSPAERIDLAGGNFSATAENIARHSILALPPDGRYLRTDRGLYTPEGQSIDTLSYRALARAVVAKWLKSPGHRANILGPYEALGCGVSLIFTSTEGIPELYFTQNFGRL